MTKNRESTRYYSDMQEKSVVKLVGGQQVSNSGAGKFRKGDVHHDGASMLIECKTSTSDKSSISIKKEWIDKNKEEAFTQRLSNTAIAVTFAPGTENYFLIDESLFRFLVGKLEEENSK